MIQKHFVPGFKYACPLPPLTKILALKSGTTLIAINVFISFWQFNMYEVRQLKMRLFPTTAFFHPKLAWFLYKTVSKDWEHEMFFDHLISKKCFTGKPWVLVKLCPFPTHLSRMSSDSKLCNESCDSCESLLRAQWQFW